MAVRLFVGNLPYDVTEAELRAHFAAIGPLSYLSLATDRDTGKPRGFAFVEFSARADAEDAIRRLHNQAFKGRLLAVNEARPRDAPAPASAPRPPTAVDPSTETAKILESYPVSLDVTLSQAKFDIHHFSGYLLASGREQ